jgi:hypothetical protein
MNIILSDEASLVSIPLIRDQYSKVLDYDHASVLHTGKCSVQPFLSIEDEVGRDTRISQMRLISRDAGFFQATAQHFVYWDSQYWKIDGKPFMWRNSGKPHHIEITMRLVEG